MILNVAEPDDAEDEDRYVNDREIRECIQRTNNGGQEWLFIMPWTLNVAATGTKRPGQSEHDDAKK